MFPCYCRDNSGIQGGATMPKVFWEYVLAPTRSGVLTSLDFVLRNGTSSNSSGSANGAFSKLTASQRESLRAYLANAEPVAQLSGM
jgi:hypothetical protein